MNTPMESIGWQGRSRLFGTLRQVEPEAPVARETEPVEEPQLEILPLVGPDGSEPDEGWEWV